ncbi:MAG TPA: ClpXP protease specificity-enhancing factor SspB [Polyangiaceae bacterium]
MRDLATKRFGSKVGALVVSEGKKRDPRPEWTYADRPRREAVLIAGLGRGTAVKVHVDPRMEGVVVPARLRDESRIVLTVSEATPDLAIGPEQMSFMLDDGGVPFACVVPWPAVRAMVGVGAGDFTWES